MAHGRIHPPHLPAHEPGRRRQRLPRAAAETPYEYLATLAAAWPEHTTETSLITQAYVNIRYGELPETQEELSQIQAAWKRLEATRPAAAAQAHTATIDLAKRTKVDARYE
ncbi:MAG: DUF4129 domain-containing protein [Chloroflexi bacterium]|nr:DUF4129 domain-containing protein [Chloroflexota bacterium]